MKTTKANVSGVAMVTRSKQEIREFPDVREAGEYLCLDRDL